MTGFCKYTIFLLTLLILGTISARAGDKDFTVSLLTPSNKVIPVYWKVNGYWSTSVKPPAVVVKNGSAAVAIIESVELTGKTGGRTAIVNFIGEPEISPLIAAVNQQLNKQISRPVRLGLSVRNGNVEIPERPFCETNALNPGDSLCLRLFDLTCLVYQGQAKIEELTIKIGIRQGDALTQVEYPVPLQTYVCKGDYIFPLKGNLAVGGLPLSLDHRSAQSQEFAFDTIEYRQDKSGKWYSASKPQAENVSDYFIFHREVLAVGDGVVVALANKYPDALAANPLLYTEEQFANWARKLVREGVEQGNILAGNYLVIDHRNGEFSFYAHLGENTMRVGIGDEVKQGQVIALVGNTGNSTEPHLHFQLMDGPDYITANGLPFIVKKRENITMMDFLNEIEYVNTLLYSDILFMFVK